jgi:hypothetical protein
VSTNFSGNTRNRKEARSGRKEVDNLVKHLNMAGTMTRRSVAHYPNMSEPQCVIKPAHVFFIDAC